jgi:hypothetical protein
MTDASMTGSAATLNAPRAPPVTASRYASATSVACSAWKRGPLGRGTTGNRPLPQQRVRQEGPREDAALLAGRAALEGERWPQANHHPRASVPGLERVEHPFHEGLLPPVTSRREAVGRPGLVYPTSGSWGVGTNGGRGRRSGCRRAMATTSVTAASAQSASTTAVPTSPLHQAPRRARWLPPHTLGLPPGGSSLISFAARGLDNGPLPEQRPRYSVSPSRSPSFARRQRPPPGPPTPEEMGSSPKAAMTAKGRRARWRPDASSKCDQCLGSSRRVGRRGSRSSAWLAGSSAKPVRTQVPSRGQGRHFPADRVQRRPASPGCSGFHPLARGPGACKHAVASRITDKTT